MTWQTETCIAPDTYLESLTSWVAVMTSEHVSASVINAGGASHVVGDVITITHASAYHDFRIEVTAVSTGAITEFIILTGGAFAERLASAVVGATGGSGNAVGDILEIQGGAATEPAKVEVLTLSGSAVATVGIFETGGAYTTAPGLTDAATIGIGPSTFAGDDACVLDLTMQTIIGTTAIAQSSTTGVGTGATFDLTLTPTGWATVYSRNERSTDGAIFQKEVVLQGTVAGANEPFIGFLTSRFDSGGEKRYAISCFGMTAFNPALSLPTQPGLGPILWTTSGNSGSNILVAEEVAEGNIWGIGVTGRHIRGFIRGNIATENDFYHSFYVGLGNGFGPTATTPYPIVVCGSSNVSNRRSTNLSSTGLSECFQDPSGGGPVYFLQKSDLVWTTVRNAITPSNVQEVYTMWPRGLLIQPVAEFLFVADDNYKMLGDGTIGSHIRANVTGKIFPTPGSLNVDTIQPLTIMSSGGTGTNTINTTPVAELDGVFFIGGVEADGTVFTPEDEKSINGTRYIIIPAHTASLANRPYQFMCFRQD